MSRTYEQLLADLKASRRAQGLPDTPQHYFEEPMTREDHEHARAEQRAADRKEGDPGSCPI